MGDKPKGTYFLRQLLPPIVSTRSATPSASGPWLTTLIAAAALLAMTLAHAGSAAAQTASPDQTLSPPPKDSPSPSTPSDSQDPGDEAASDAAENRQAAPAQPAVVEGPRTVGWLELSGPLRQGPPPFAWADPEDLQPALGDVLSQIEHVAENESSLGLVVYLDGPELTFAQMHAISKELADARDAGKRVIAFAEAYDLASYYLASAADLIVLQHKGSVELSGMVIEEMYLAGMLEKIGVEADLMQVGRFKGAEEPMTRKGPSEAWDENIDGLLDDLYAQLVEVIADRRGWKVEQLETLMAESWGLDDRGLLRSRLIDRLSDRDLNRVTEIEFGDDFTWDEQMGTTGGGRAMPQNPFAMFQMLFNAKPARIKGPTVAVFHGYGPIHRGESSIESGPFSSASIGARTVTDYLAELRDDPQVKAVVLRLDSPGGSALASEIIWQEIRRFGEEKPIFASIGSSAASGGYYLASGADEVFVSPQSIVGSIGVVSGKLTFGGLYEKIGISVTRRTRGPLGGMFNSVEPFNDTQRDAVRQAMERIYEQFLDRVAIGRGRRLPDVTQVAAGRLFTGRQAVDNGMADALGSLDDAIAAAAERAELAEDGYDVLHLPRPLSFGEYLSEAMGVRGPRSLPTAVHHSDAAAAFTALRHLLGEPAWNSITRQLEALLLLRDEATLLVAPSAIVVR
jgi:protease IV